MLFEASVYNSRWNKKQSMQGLWSLKVSKRLWLFLFSLKISYLMRLGCAFLKAGLQAFSLKKEKKKIVSLTAPCLLTVRGTILNSLRGTKDLLGMQLAGKKIKIEIKDFLLVTSVIKF